MKKNSPSNLRFTTKWLTVWSLLSLPLSASKISSISIQPFQCGENHVRDVSVFSPGVDKGKPKRLVVSCFLVNHPKGILLWNTGLSDSIANKKEGLSVKNGAFTLKLNKTVLQSLSELGTKPESIKYVAMSHLHPDHSGNLKAFKHSKILIHRNEIDAAFNGNAEKYSINTKLLPQKSSKQYTIIADNHDVFGDGKIKIIQTPGHTPGHQSLIVRTSPSKTIILAGDLYHFHKNRQHKRVPSFNFSQKQTLQSMNKLETIAKKMNAEVWIEHDPDQMEKLYTKRLF